MRGRIARVEQLRNQPPSLIRRLAIELVTKNILPIVEDGFEEAIDIERIVRRLPCEFRRNPATDSDLKPATVPI